MFFPTSSRGGKLLLGVLLLLLAIGGQTQSLERIAFSLTLPDGRSGGILQRSTVTNMVQRPEGLYVLTERGGCYLISSSSDREHSLLAEPTGRKEKFNTLIEQDREVHLLVDYKSLRPLVHQEKKPFSFTSTYFTKTVNPTAIHYGEDGRIIVGSSADGLFLFYPDEFGGYSNVPKRVSTANRQLPSNVIHTLYEDKAGVVWVGTDSGLATITQDSVYNLGTAPKVRINRWQRFWGIEGPAPLYSGPVKAIAEWGDSIVFACNEGLYRVPTRPDSLAIVYNYDLKDRLPEPLDNVKQLLVDLNGDLWIAANQLLRFNITQDRLKVYDHSSGLRAQGVCALLEDAATNQLWIGTQRGGLYRMSNEPYTEVED